MGSAHKNLMLRELLSTAECATVFGQLEILSGESRFKLQNTAIYA